MANSPHDLGAKPIEPHFYDKMNSIAHSLDVLFNGETAGVARTTGFVLLVFPVGDTSGRANYISNGVHRGDVIRLMEDQITRFRAEGHGDDDAPMIELMATAIGREMHPQLTDSEGRYRERLRAAAQAAMLAYRKGV